MEINPSISLNPILGEKTAGILNRGIAAQRLLKHIRQQGEAHLDLRYFADPRPDILSLLALNEPLVVICAAHSRFITEEPTEPAALRGIPWVTYPLNEGSSGEPFARLLKQQLLRHDLQSDERIVIDSLTAQKRLIEADFGIGLLPASSIEEELQLGALRVLPIDALRASALVMAIYRRHAYLSKAARLLLAMLTAQANAPS